MKTNQPGKQNPLFLYVDKIVFGVLVLAGLYYCYSAVSLQKISWTPQQLTDDSTAATTTIENSTFREEFKPTDYGLLARDIRSGFSAIYYQTPEKWEAAVFGEKIMREMPFIHPVTKLRAVSGVGALTVREGDSVFGSATASTMGGGMSSSSEMGAYGDVSGIGGTTGGAQASGLVEPTHWVLLTGLIPYEEQLREYIAKYANALHSSPYDYPDYLFVEIWRNEIGKNNPDGTPLWDKLPVVRDYATNMNKWAGVGDDPVDFNYILPISPRDSRCLPMAGPVPPLANRIFGQEVAYPPYIPLMADSLRDQIKTQQGIIQKMLQNWRPIDLPDILNDENRPFGVPQGAAMGGAGGGLGGGGYGGGGAASAITGMYNPGGMGGAGRAGGMAGGDYGTSPGGFGGGMGSDYGGGMGGVSGATGRGGMNDQWKFYTDIPPSVMVEAKYRLFRYFDFTVERGKSYQYRVKLGVYNPNHLLADRFLDEKAIPFKKEPVLWSEFSYPSGPAAVISNARVVAKSVGNLPPATRNWQSQNVTVSSIVFNEDDNEDYIAKDIVVTQGKVLNFLNQNGQKVSELTSSGTMGGTDTSGMTTTPSTGGRGTTQQPKATSKSLNHISGECVLDIVGKRKLIGTNSEHTPQGQVLLMAFDGTIQIQSIKTNKLELDRYEKPATTTTSGDMY